jgi:hypothetical protein
MSNSDTKWSADGTNIPNIEPHTKTKHLLIEQYVTDLICTLYGQENMASQLLLLLMVFREEVFTTIRIT